MITLYGFGRVQEMVIGATRDLRALWALEETGLEYRVHGLDNFKGELKTEAFREISPFQQVPVIDDEGLVIAESGAILLYLAEKANRLIAPDPAGRAHVTQWCFAALNSVEPPIFQIALLDMLEGDDPTAPARRARLARMSAKWLGPLDARMATRDHVAGDGFTVADILMATVLRQARKLDLLGDFAHLRAYAARCEARPAWQRTLDAYERRLGAPAGSAR